MTFNQAYSNNLQITNVTYDAGANTLNFDISWDNAFRVNSGWTDHIYIFAKYKNSNGSTWESVFLEGSGHSDDEPSMFVSSAGGSIVIDGDYFGIEVGHLSSFSSGTQGGNCTVLLSENMDFFNPSFRVFGIEFISTNYSSVYVDYYVGDGSSANRFHKGDDTTQAYFWDYIGSNANVGNGPYDINTTHPSGIPVSTINLSIFRAPKSIMKYEISQIQYVQFLNCLNREAQNNRVETDISGNAVSDVYVMSGTPTVMNRNGIRCDASIPNGGPVTFYCDLNGNGVPNEYDDGQNIAMNHLSGADFYAFLDWAGMQPMNEIEYEEICRGSNNWVPNEFAWGSSAYNEANPINDNTYGSPDEKLNGSISGPIGNANSPMRCGTPATATTNRLTSGASAYGIMELSGNVPELYIALVEEECFTTSIYAPNGMLDNFGNHDENWPEIVTRKGVFTGSGNTLGTVSYREPNVIDFNERSYLNGGRGGY